MKTLIAIWLAVIVSGVFAWMFIHGQVFGLDIVRTEQAKVIGKPYNPQQTISGEVLQPAGKVKANFTDTYNPQQTAPASVLEQTNVTIN